MDLLGLVVSRSHRIFLTMASTNRHFYCFNFSDSYIQGYEVPMLVLFTTTVTGEFFAPLLSLMEKFFCLQLFVKDKNKHGLLIV